MNWYELALRVPVQELDRASAAAVLCSQNGFSVEDYSDLRTEVTRMSPSTCLSQELLEKDRSVAVIRLYFERREQADEAGQFFEEQLQDSTFEIFLREVDDASWTGVWKQWYHPFLVGKRLAIRPSWEEWTPPVGRAVMTLDPGAAFGTGTHHTTRLCLELLDACVKSGERVLDMGCGSGILGIAALLLGAESVTAVDLDPYAVSNASQNAGDNGFDTNRFTALSGDVLSEEPLRRRIGADYGMICANIVADILIAQSDYYFSVLRNGGLLLASGIIEGRQQEVESAFLRSGFTLFKRERSENWHALLLQK